ncbi:hypothetical protein G7046_g2534 [Stylonectria norvegica]|nr:hypothetical protein G7046_g2534 [Stylonectria norvegica]
MAQHKEPSSYTQGYSNSTIATHLSRTAETDAAFLLPHVKRSDRILDVGCGPGTITTSLAKYADEGATVGVDISTDVLQKAKTLAAEASVPTEGPGSVVFEQGDVLKGLAYADDTLVTVRRDRDATGAEAWWHLGHTRCDGPAFLPTQQRPRPIMGAEPRPGGA